MGCEDLEAKTSERGHIGDTKRDERLLAEKKTSAHLRGERDGGVTGSDMDVTVTSNACLCVSLIEEERTEKLENLSTERVPF
jgi:hypothetical protein